MRSELSWMRGETARLRPQSHCSSGAWIDAGRADQPWRSFQVLSEGFSPAWSGQHFTAASPGEASTSSARASVCSNTAVPVIYSRTPLTPPTSPCTACDPPGTSPVIHPRTPLTLQTFLTAHFYPAHRTVVTRAPSRSRRPVAGASAVSIHLVHPARLSPSLSRMRRRAVAMPLRESIRR